MTEPVSPLVHAAVVEIDPDATGTFARWFDDAHIDDVLASGQWRRVRRFACTSDAALQFLVYEPRDGAGQVATPPAVFRSAAGRRSIWAYAADTYAEVARFGALADEPSHINAITTQVTPAGAAEFDGWYNRTHVPEILACPGWLAARRFRSVHDASRFLAIYDLSDPLTPFRTPEYDAAVGWDDVEHHLLGYHGFRTYDLEASRSRP